MGYHSSAIQDPDVQSQCEDVSFCVGQSLSILPVYIVLEFFQRQQQLTMDQRICIVSFADASSDPFGLLLVDHVSQSPYCYHCINNENNYGHIDDIDYRLWTLYLCIM